MDSKLERLLSIFFHSDGHDAKKGEKSNKDDEPKEMMEIKKRRPLMLLSSQLMSLHQNKLQWLVQVYQILMPQAVLKKQRLMY